MLCYLHFWDYFWWAFNIICEAGLLFTLSGKNMQPIRIFVAWTLAGDLAMAAFVNCWSVYRMIWWGMAFSRAAFINYAAVCAVVLIFQGKKIPKLSILPSLITLGIVYFAKMEFDNSVLMLMLAICLLPALLLLIAGFLARSYAYYARLPLALMGTCLGLAILAQCIAKYGVSPLLSRLWAVMWLLCLYGFWKAHKSMSCTGRKGMATTNGV